jgi:hypothetical protein
VLVGTRLATIAIVAATDVLEASKKRQNPWSKKIRLDSDTLFALAEVARYMPLWKGWPICCWHTGITWLSILPFKATATLDRKIPARRVHDRRAVMASDASDFVVASYSVEGLPEFTFAEELSLEERAESLTCRELLAILRTLQFAEGSGTLGKGWQPAQVTIWWLTDNQNVEKILSKGSGILRLTKLVLDILRTARALEFDIQPVSVSRKNHFLLKAEGISKGIDTDNWDITEEYFYHLSGLFGIFSIDLFATRDNAKCERFYSQSFEKGTLGVDAFARHWEDECAYAAPPVALVMRTIRKGADCNITGIFVIPLWKNARFWTYAFRGGVHLNAIFFSVKIVRMHARAWEFSRRDLLGGKEIQFLVFRFRRIFGQGALQSLPGKGRCFKALFKNAYACAVCVALSVVKG